MKNCIRCGNEIPAERVEALPETRLCITCSEAVGSDFIMLVHNERTSKPGSLKHNYGGVSVEFVRRYIPPLPRGN